MINCCDTDEFIKLISDKKLWIYGAGYVASNFFDALKKNRIENKVQGFIVSQITDNKKDIEGIPVIQFDKIRIEMEDIICLAVHETVKGEIEQVLSQKEIDNYIWVVPFLYDLYLGNPLKAEAWIDIYYFLNQYREQYGLALRWMAIEDYYGKCINGFYLYQKAMSLHCSKETAAYRVERFKNLIQDWEKNGYDSKWQISINQEYEILDGEHRVSLACYHGQKQVKCKIYGGNNIHSKKIVLTKQVLFNSGFSQEELDKLDILNTNIRLNILEDKHA